MALAATLGGLPAPVEAGYRAGTARVVITPSEPMWAGGYGDRNRPVSEKVHDLYAKALVLEDARGQRLVILTTDLLGLPKTIADAVAENICRRLNISREQVLLTSSHTHCGPVLRENLVDIYPLGPDEWAKIERYSDWLKDRLVEVVVEAAATMAPARIAHGIGRAGFAVNRRENREADAGVEGFAPKGPVDHDVPVLRVAGLDGSLRAVLFGYACHCTTLNFYQWCGDYAGFAQLDLEAAHPGATAMFFAGCGGDANPLPRRKLELAEKYGRELADAVQRVLGASMQPLDGHLAAAFRRIDLPLDRLPDREQLEQQRDTGNRYQQSLARRMLARLDSGQPLMTTYPYPVQALQLGRGLTLVALGGEVVVDYSLRLKKELGPQSTWVAAYANDVMAYIPSRRVLAEGGYEGETAMAVYGLPGRWSPEVEEMIVETVHQLAKQIRTSP